MVLGAAKVRFADLKTRVDASRDVVALTPVVDEAVPVDWNAAQTGDFSLNDLEKTPTPGLPFGDLPRPAATPKNYTGWSRDFIAWVYGNQKLELFRSPSTGLISNPGEDERDFRIRLQQSAREQRDEAADALRKKYTPKMTTLQEKIRKAQQAVERETAQASQAKMQTAVSVGATLLGAFMGRKAMSTSTIGRASTALGRAGRSMEQAGDIERAQETAAEYQRQLDDLNAQFKEETDALEAKIDPAGEALEPVGITPKKTDIIVQLVSLVWVPYRPDAEGRIAPAW
jgi:hypothetical protein